MKNLMIVLIFILSCSLSFSQTNDDLNTLKKQVNALKSRNAKLELRLKEYVKNTKGVTDSLQMQLKDDGAKIVALTDSLASKEKIHTFTQNKVQMLHHSIKICNTFLYIILILIVLVIVIMYILTVRRIESGIEKNEVKLTNAKDAIENELNKTKKDLLAQITSIKDEITKLKEQKK